MPEYYSSRQAMVDSMEELKRLQLKFMITSKLTPGSFHSKMKKAVEDLEYYEAQRGVNPVRLVN
jgi:hypothetical protein